MKVNRTSSARLQRTSSASRSASACRRIQSVASRNVHPLGGLEVVPHVGDPLEPLLPRDAPRAMVEGLTLLRAMVEGLTLL